MRKQRRHWSKAGAGLIAALGVIIMMALATPAANAAPATTSEAAVGTTTHAMHENAAAVRAYWTPQRMRDAIDMDAVPRSSGPVATQPPVAHGAAATLAEPRVRAHTGVTPDNLTVSSTQGKVYFHDPSTNQNGKCSGGVINNPAKDMVMTAGHCVFNGSAWVTDFYFVPAYDNGSVPYGSWAANYATAPNPWLDTGDVDYDVAVVNVQPLNGAKLVDTVGGNGLNYNQGLPVVTIWGYPSGGGGYNGEIPYYCQNFQTYAYGARIEAGCTMTVGASGGPWLMNYDATTGLGYEDGDTSTTAQPAGYIASPYFGSYIDTLYTNTENL